jgi:hypothetical protein
MPAVNWSMRDHDPVRHELLRLRLFKTERNESPVNTGQPLQEKVCNPLDFLEKPEYYSDAYHLNAKGWARFTETLVTEIVGRFGGSEPAYVCAFLALELF